MALTQVTGGLIASGQTINTHTISGYINLATWTTGTRPTITTSGSNTIITWTSSSGTYTG